MYFKYFQHARYINLDRRTDRREAFERRTSELGLSIPRFSAVEIAVDDPLIPEELRIYKRINFKIGCNLSHQRIVKQAVQENWENVLVFEDDCLFEPEFSQKIQTCVDELKSLPTWDIFYMGGEPNAPCDTLTENLRLVNSRGGIYGTHAYAINHTFYNRLLKINPIQSASIDVIYMHLYPRTYVITKELLATQDDTESDLWGGIINRKNQYKETYNRYVK